MLILPISSRVAVMLYDHEAYTIRKRDRNSEFITVARDDEERLNKLQMLGGRTTLYLPRPERHQAVQKLAREVRYIRGLNSEKVVPSVARSDDGLSQVITTELPPVEFGDWAFQYESKEWREVPLEIRGLGVYGSRTSTPEDGPKALENIRPWNSTRYYGFRRKCKLHSKANQQIQSQMTSECHVISRKNTDLLTSLIATGKMVKRSNPTRNSRRNETWSPTRPKRAWKP